MKVLMHTQSAINNCSKINFIQNLTWFLTWLLFVITNTFLWSSTKYVLHFLLLSFCFDCLINSSLFFRPLGSSSSVFHFSHVLGAGLQPDNEQTCTLDSSTTTERPPYTYATKGRYGHSPLLTIISFVMVMTIILSSLESRTKRF